MTTAERASLREQLIKHEGLRLRVYTDSLGILTIGVGRNVRDKGLTGMEALYLLDNDIDECEADLLTFPWFVTLNAIRQRAVLDLRFNLGPTKLRQFKKFLGAMNACDFPTAAAELMDSRWFLQVQPSRGQRIVRQILNGV
jgi:lysozyme